MQIQENISLKPYNSFHIDARARYFSTFSSIEELTELTTHHLPAPKESIRTGQTGSQLTTLILGGGSNILFSKDFDGLVLKNEIMGIEELHEDSEYAYVKAGAGENWHQFVQHCINKNWAGVENLSLIPGLVGASPMQNIGAYGVELTDVFWCLEAFHLREKKMITFTAGDCGFGYRESVFKRRYKDQFVILNVTFRLRKHPVFHTSYGAVEQELEKMGVKQLSIRAISDAVINIRSSKLPNPEQIGNAGSFYKNPEIINDQYLKIKNRFPAVVAYSLPNGNKKLAAAWLIEQCGPKDSVSWKGFRRGDAGCHETQALVLVNYANATGKEINDLGQEILQSVKEKFGVELEREVNVI